MQRSFLVLVDPRLLLLVMNHPRAIHFFFQLISIQRMHLPLDTKITGQPSRIPTRQPTRQPSRQPSSRPSHEPTRQPTRFFPLLDIPLLLLSSPI